MKKKSKIKKKIYHPFIFNFLCCINNHNMKILMKLLYFLKSSDKKGMFLCF